MFLKQVSNKFEKIAQKYLPYSGDVVDWARCEC